VLAALLKAHLLERAPEIVDRWRMHDLLRLYAQESPDADIDPVGRGRALDRLFDYYMGAAEAAGVHLVAAPGVEMPDRFADREGALAWLDAERPNLVATVLTAAADGRHPVGSRLAVALADYFNWRRPLDDWLATAEAGLTSANMLGDLNSRAVALSNLGRALNAARRFAEAISAHRKAAATWKILGNRGGEGVALHNIGVSLKGLRRFDDAIAAFLQDLEICRKAGDLPGEATTLDSLGGCLLEADRLDEAIAALRDAAAIQRELGDRHGEGMTLNNLAGALARHAVAEFSAAEESSAVDSILKYLSIQARKEEKLDEAITCSQQALTVFRETQISGSRSTAVA
jgi:tetratricopeptide (TPR) repeat protein